MIKQDFELKGLFEFQQIRNNQIIRSFSSVNRIVSDGRKKALDMVFKGGVNALPSSNWRIGLAYNAASFSAFTVATTDTMSSHPGWEEVGGYASTTRPRWIIDSAIGVSPITNATNFIFDMNVGYSVDGAFIAVGGAATKGATDGILWSVCKVSARITGSAGDKLVGRYTVTF